MAKHVLLAAVASVLMLSSCQQPNRQIAPGFDQYGVTEVSGALDLSGDYRQERRSNANGRLDLRELRFREELTVMMAGYYYHPKLVEFELETLMGLEQRYITTDGGVPSNSVDGQNLGYDLMVRTFKDLSYSADFFASRHQSFTRQAFFPTSEVTVENVGVRGKANDWWIPSVAELSHYSFTGRGLNTYGESREQFKIEGRRLEDDAQYHYLAEANHVEQNSRATAINDLNLIANTTHLFGFNREHRLTNSVFTREQDGDNATSSLTTNTNYHHQWTDNLSSAHGLGYSSTSRNDTSNQTLNLNSSINHQLFKSLNSSAGATWSTGQFGEGSMNSYGVNGALAYTKETPIGRLGLSQSLDVMMRDRGSLQGIAGVLDESFVYTPGNPMILSNIAVDNASIVVKDSTGLLFYTRNVDYFVVPLGSQTRIDIPVTSLISPGDTILVDYDFQPTPEQGLRTTTSTSNASLAISENLNFSVGQSVVTQDLVSGYSDGTLEDSTRTYAAATYSPWLETTFSAHYEDYESNLTPFRRVNGSVHQSISVFEFVDWQASGDTYYVTYGDDPRAEHGVSASTYLLANMSASLSASLMGEYHQATFRTDEGTGYMTEFKVRKYLGKTLLTFTAGYVNEEFDIAADQALLRLQFHVTRNF